MAIIGTTTVKTPNRERYLSSPEIPELALIFPCIFDIILKAHRHKLTRYFAGKMKLLIGHKEKFVLLQPAM